MNHNTSQHSLSLSLSHTHKHTHTHTHTLRNDTHCGFSVTVRAHCPVDRVVTSTSPRKAARPAEVPKSSQSQRPSGPSTWSTTNSNRHPVAPPAPAPAPAPAAAAALTLLPPTGEVTVAPAAAAVGKCAGGSGRDSICRSVVLSSSRLMPSLDTFKASAKPKRARDWMASSSPHIIHLPSAAGENVE